MGGSDSSLLPEADGGGELLASGSCAGRLSSGPAAPPPLGGGSQPTSNSPAARSQTIWSRGRKGKLRVVHHSDLAAEIEVTLNLPLPAEFDRRVKPKGGRSKKLTSIDKANVLESSRVWRQVAVELGKEFSDVQLEHQLVDSCAMRLVTAPGSFDVTSTSSANRSRIALLYSTRLRRWTAAILPGFGLAAHARSIAVSSAAAIAS